MRRPPYWKPPCNICDACGTSLYQQPRWRVHIYIKRGPLAGARLKTLHLCQNCLKKLLKQYGKRYKIRYRKMPTLGARPPWP